VNPRAALRALGGTALACWAGVAAVAVFAPKRLSTVVFGMRLDTAGAACFGAAAVLLLASALLAGPARVVRAVLVTVGALATGGWLYIGGNALRHPQTLHLGLTHFARRPTEGQFGVGCLVLSVACLTAASLARKGAP
jgi:hypothetical protein